MINWKSEIWSEQKSIFDRVLSPDSQRTGINSLMSDIMFYMVPWRRSKTLEIVANKMNTRMEELKSEFPRKFDKAKISIIGYSLGSCISHDLLSLQHDYVLNPSLPVPDNPEINSKSLQFQVQSLILFGSPLSAYLQTIRDEHETARLSLPHRIKKYFNIFHPLDPVAFRQEPLFHGCELTECAPAVPLADFTCPTGFKKQTRWERIMGAASTSNSGGSLPAKKRLDFEIIPPKHLIKDVKMPMIEMSYNQVSSHYSYFDNKDVSLFVLRTLTGFNPASEI